MTIPDQTVSAADGAGAASSLKRPLRVLMATARYFPYTGGVENHVYQVARRLAAQGVAVTVLSADPSGALPAEETLEGVRVRRVKVVPGSGDSYLAPDIYRATAEGAWDVVHCQCYHTFVAPTAMLAAARSGVPYILTFHGGGHSSRLRNWVRPLQLRLLRPLIARAERLVATARFEVDYFGQLLGLPREQFVYVPNGGDIAEVPLEAQADAGGPLIVSVGRLERYKGHHRAIEAMPTVLAAFPDARLWIAGSGPYEPALRRLARALDIADRVDISAVPAADRTGMARGLARASLVVLLSEYETHPMAAVEAAALGRPLLVAATSGLSEIAEQGYARSVPLASSPGQIAEAMIAQLRDPVIPRGMPVPSWDDCTAALLTLYQEIAGRRC